MVLRLIGLAAAATLMADGPPQSLPSPAPPPAPAPAPGAEEEEQVALERDWMARMTVPVEVDGRGPYRFIIDTGAERTVISQELARELKLSEGTVARMYSVSDVRDVATVVIPSLKVSRKPVTGIHAPALAARNLGAHGLLGVDSLQSQRVLFDFENQRMLVRPSRRSTERPEPGTIVVQARSRFGRLILADAKLDGEKLWVVVDTGAQVSIGNEALRSKLSAKRKLGLTVPVEMTSVTGAKLVADYTRVKSLRIGGLGIFDMPIAFADIPPFKKLGLVDRPALLLGMDTLSLFDSVTVDFANRKVQFDIPDLSARGSATRLAARTTAAPRGIN